MAARNTTFKAPSWMVGATISLIIAAALYVFVYGGEVATPGLILLGVIGTGLGAFTVYLFYRFVVAVETIAEKH